MSKKAKPKRHVVDPVWLIRWYQNGERFIAANPASTHVECSHEFQRQIKGLDLDKEKAFDARCGWDNGVYNWRQRNDDMVVDEFGVK